MESSIADTLRQRQAVQTTVLLIFNRLFLALSCASDLTEARQRFKIEQTLLEGDARFQKIDLLDLEGGSL